MIKKKKINLIINTKKKLTENWDKYDNMDYYNYPQYNSKKYNHLDYELYPIRRETDTDNYDSDDDFIYKDDIMTKEELDRELDEIQSNIRKYKNKY